MRNRSLEILNAFIDAGKERQDQWDKLALETAMDVLLESYHRKNDLLSRVFLALEDAHSHDTVSLRSDIEKELNANAET